MKVHEAFKAILKGKKVQPNGQAFCYHLVEDSDELMFSFIRTDGIIDRTPNRVRGGGAYLSSGYEPFTIVEDVDRIPVVLVVPKGMKVSEVQDELAKSGSVLKIA